MSDWYKSQPRMLAPPTALAAGLLLLSHTHPLTLAGFGTRPSSTLRIAGVAAAAHTLKGSSGNLGGRRLAALASRLETAAKAGDWTLAEELIPAVERAFEVFVEALSQHR